MKTILVPTDFSTAATNAANYAAQMALAINADLSLLFVYQIPITYNEIPVPLDVDQMIEDAENTIIELKEQLTQNTAGKIKIETKVEIGIFFQELKAACERLHPYAVVMGSQGTTAAQRFIFGGHTLNAMRNLRWPLITVPPGSSFSSVKRIGLACDFDKVTHTIPLDEIKALVNDFNAELHILNTGREQVFDPELVFQSSVLQELLSPLIPFCHFISSKNTDEGIMEFADKNNIDLLIVIPKRRDLLQTILHRSHGRNLILHSHVPVMSIHQQDNYQEEGTDGKGNR